MPLGAVISNFQQGPERCQSPYCAVDTSSNTIEIAFLFAPVILINHRPAIPEGNLPLQTDICELPPFMLYELHVSRLQPKRDIYTATMLRFYRSHEACASASSSFSSSRSCSRCSAPFLFSSREISSKDVKVSAAAGVVRRRFVVQPL